MAVTVVSWNIAKKHEPWRELLQMDADVALLQEASPPPDDVMQLRDATLPPAERASVLDVGPQEVWDSHSWNSDWWRGRWSALYDRWPMVVRLSDRVDIEWFKQVGPIGWPEQDEIAVSGIGTITAARITPRDGSTEPFIAISMYGRWIGSHPSVKTSWSFGYADASVHRIISDLSTFIGHENPQTHRILAAGDLNILHGYGDGGRPPYWDARYRSVFERMAAIGMEFVGATGAGRTTGGDAGDTRTRGLPKRGDVLPPRQEPDDCKQQPAGLRLCVARLPREHQCKGHELR